jgi:cell division protein FtsI/penicillin-binding protein 2
MGLRFGGRKEEQDTKGRYLPSRKLEKKCKALLGDLRGGIIAMNPFNGQIRVLINEDIVAKTAFPPREFFDLVIAFSAVNEAIIDWKDRIECKGGDMGSSFCEVGHGRVNAHEAILLHCKSFFSAISRRLGGETLVRYARIFGFGVCTGTLEGEETGVIPAILTPEEVSSLALGNSLIKVTGIQVLNLVNSFVNNGILYKPLVREDENMRLGLSPDILSTIPFSPHLYQELRLTLRGVVVSQFSRHKALRDLDAAGLFVETSTTTSQICIFAGFAPFKDPKISIIVLVENGDVRTLSRISKGVFQLCLKGI